MQANVALADDSLLRPSNDESEDNRELELIVERNLQN